MGKTRKKEGIPKWAGRMVTGLETVGGKKKKKKRISSVVKKKKNYFQIS